MSKFFAIEFQWILKRDVKRRVPNQMDRGCFKGETFNYSIVGEEIVIEYLYILNGDKFQEIVHIVIYK